MVDLYWLRRPQFEAMQYNTPADLVAMNTWATSKPHDNASDWYINRIEETEDGGFAIYGSWVWDPTSEFVSGTGAPTDWVVYYYGSFNIQTNEQFMHDYEPVVAIPEPTTGETP